MKVEVRNKVLHFLPESWNELMTAGWIFDQLGGFEHNVALGKGNELVIARPEYPSGVENTESWERRKANLEAMFEADRDAVRECRKWNGIE